MSQEIINGKTFGEERALYGMKNVALEDCRFEGEEDGESALKECGDVYCKNCYFDLRYPLWHDKSVTIEDCEMTENCRAALWYSKNIHIIHSKLNGIKATRECNAVTVRGSEIVSPEFGWSTDDITFIDTKVKSEYFLLRASNVKGYGLELKGKYSFQYVKNATLENCKFDTKDAFWHSENITVKNSVIIGEYLGWYSKNLTLENCTVIGTQPLCYCKNLRLVDCVMQKTDLCFERSEVRATIRTDVDSIKNPYKGVIVVPSVGELIRDDEKSKAKILITPDIRREIH